MSMESELEALIVRIKVNTDQFTDVENRVKELAKFIETKLQEASLDKITPTIDSGQLTKDLANVTRLVSSTVTNLKTMTKDIPITIGTVSTEAEANLKQLGRYASMPGFANFAASIGKAAKGIEALQGSSFLSTFAGQLVQVADAAQKITPASAGHIKLFADAVSYAHKRLEFVGSITGVANFGSDVWNAYSALQHVGSAANLKSFGDNVSAAMSRFSKWRAPNLTALTQFANDLRNAYNQLLPISRLGSFSSFAASLRSAHSTLAKIGAAPQLVTFASNANTAATALRNLNKELAWYVIYMNQINGLNVRMPRPPGPPTGRNVGLGANGPFRFDPVQRSLGRLTGMATGLAIGYFGFQLVREVSDFDEQMTRAMALANFHIQQGTMNLGMNTLAGVRRTAELGILAIASRTATSPHDLAAGFRELTEAGYGTANALQALAVVEKFAFVSGMDTAKAAKELSVLMRQMGLVSNDTATNMRELRRVTDAIASGMMISGLSADHFLKGLERLTPHMQFMNRGAEDSIALLTAFGRIDSSSAVSRAEHLMRGIQQQFTRSETFPGSIRIGAPTRIDPLGMHNRAFHAGMGVHPIHMLQDRVMQPTHAWRNLGVTDPTNIIQTVNQLDAALRRVEPSMRQAHIMTLGLRPDAQEALISLLNSTEAMEAFALAARRADGIIDQLANDRLRSFSNQAKMLTNNISIIGIQLANFVAPALREINALLIIGFDWWNNLGRAGQETVFAMLGVVAGLVALRAGVQVSIAVFRWLFIDTIVAGVNAAAFSFNLLVGSVNLMIAVGGLLWTTLKSLYVGFMILYGWVFAARAAIAAFSLTALLTSAWVVTLKVATWLWNAALFVMSALLSFMNPVLMGAVIHSTALSIAQLAAKAATWLWNAALAGLNVMLTATVALLMAAGIGIVTLTLAIVALVGITFAGMYAIQALLSLVLGLVELARGNGDTFEAMWERFSAGAVHAFWATAGFIENFKHNAGVLMRWLDANWQNITFNITHFADVAFRNLWVNIRVGFVNMLREMGQAALNFGQDLILAISGSPAAPGARARLRALLGETAPSAVPMLQDIQGRGQGHDMARRDLEGMVARARERGDNAAANRLQQHLDQHNQITLRRLTPLHFAPGGLGAASAALGLLGMPMEGLLLHALGANAIRTDVSPDLRQTIEGIGRAGRNTQPSETAAELGNRIGDTFREISLNRFVLQGTATQEDQQREDRRQMDVNNELLAGILTALTGEVAPEVIAAATIPVIP